LNFNSYICAVAVATDSHQVCWWACVRYLSSWLWLWLGVSERNAKLTFSYSQWYIGLCYNRHGTSIAITLHWMDSTSTSRSALMRNVNMLRNWWSTRTCVVVTLFSSLLM